MTDPCSNFPLRVIRALGRIFLWLLPIAVTALLIIGLEGTEHTTRLVDAGQSLLQGDLDTATAELRGLHDSPWVGAEARLGHQIVRAFEDGQARPPSPDQAATMGSDAFPLPLLIRAAFERGQFDSALRLTDLADSLGHTTVPLLTTAARIEAGLPVPSDIPAVVPTSSLLADRITAHLDSPRAPGVVLRDRQGSAMGHLVDGRIEPSSGVRPELLPKTLVDLASSHQDAGSLRLSLDLELSRAALASFGRYRGSIVLVDPQTGEILTAVSDRRTHARNGGTPAFEQGREPASISKLITTAAYLRTGRDPEARLRGMRCRGHESYDGVRLYCPSIAGPLRGLDRAMAVSCNVAFANLAVEIGRRPVLDELRRFGFDRYLGPFPGGKIVQPWGDDRQLADMAIGLEATEITPLHAALLAAVMANDGVMPEPTLLGSTDGRLGLHPRAMPRSPGTRVLEPSLLPPLLESMTAVMNRGTGRRMRTPGFPVAMKTGTASHPMHGFHVNYIGFGPLPNSRLAFCVRITHQRTSKRVRKAATEVTAQLLRKLRRISNRRGWQESPPRQYGRQLATRGVARPGMDGATTASDGDSTRTAR